MLYQAELHPEVPRESRRSKHTIGGSGVPPARCACRGKRGRRYTLRLPARASPRDVPIRNVAAAARSRRIIRGCSGCGFTTFDDTLLTRLRRRSLPRSTSGSGVPIGFPRASSRKGQSSFHVAGCRAPLGDLARSIARRRSARSSVPSSAIGSRSSMASIARRSNTCSSGGRGCCGAPPARSPSRRS